MIPISLKISEELKQTVMEIGSTQLFVRLIEGDYPPYQKIIPKLQFGNPIEDLSPLLPRNEFNENMIVNTVSRSKKIFEAN